jgi:hypothetical protein
MELAKIVVTLDKDGSISVMAAGPAALQVLLAVDAAGRIAAHNAVDHLTNGASPESALEKAITDLRGTFWKQYKAEVEAVGK